MLRLRSITSILLIPLMVFISNSGRSQEMLGIASSRYSGINGALLNPASPVASPYYLDINVLSMGLFFENNYIYMDKKEYRFRNFLSSNPDFTTHPPDGKFYYDYFDGTDKKGDFNARLMGPSASLVLGRHAFGLYFDARSALSVRNVPYQMAKFMFEGLTFPPQYDIELIHDQHIKASSLAWGEAALNYSYVVSDEGSQYWAAGITLKYLAGYAGTFAKFTHTDYMVPDRDTLIVYHVTGEAGIALPLDYQTNRFSSSPLFPGQGVAVDIGVVFQQKKKVETNSYNYSSLCSQVYVPYRFRLGISLLDIGGIRFKKNALKFNLDDRSTFWPGINSGNYVSVNDFISQVSNRFYGNPGQIISGDRFTIGLPTAVALTADMNYTGDWYINGTFIAPVPVIKYSVVRPALLAVAPRYETRNLAFGLTMSLYEWNRLHWGMNARFRGFFIGTEKISGFFHFNDFTGMDIYGGLKLSFQKGHCKKTSNYSCGNNEYSKYKIKIKKPGWLKKRQLKSNRLF